MKKNNNIRGKIMIGVTEIFAILAVSAIAIGAYFFINKNSAKTLNNKNKLTDNEVIVPNWLVSELDTYKKNALAYHLSLISDTKELSNLAKQKQKEVGTTALCPTLILLDAVKKNNCTIKNLNQFLSIFYKQETGSALNNQLDFIQQVQDMLLKQAEKIASDLQNS